MATHRLHFLDVLQPDSSGNVYWKPSTIDDANDRFPHPVLAFSDSGTKAKATGRLYVPKNYVGTAKIGLRWKTTATTGNAVFDVEYKSIAVAESLDPSTDDEALTVTDGAAWTARLANDAEVTLTSSNLAADDTLLVDIARDGADAADTLAAEVQLVDAWLEYADV